MKEIEILVYLSIGLMLFILGIGTIFLSFEVVDKETLEKICKDKFGEDYFYVDNEYGSNSNISCGLKYPIVKYIKSHNTAYRFAINDEHELQMFEQLKKRGDGMLSPCCIYGTIPKTDEGNVWDLKCYLDNDKKLKCFTDIDENGDIIPSW